MTYAEILIEMRQRHNLTQTALAEKLAMSYVGVGYIESGKRTPNSRSRHKIMALIPELLPELWEQANKSPVILDRLIRTGIAPGAITPDASSLLFEKEVRILDLQETVKTQKTLIYRLSREVGRLERENAELKKKKPTPIKKIKKKPTPTKKIRR